MWMAVPSLLTVKSALGVDGVTKVLKQLCA
jgi:hypothetical protein